MLQMAKRRGVGRGRPKGELPAKEVLASFRGSPEFAAWFNELVDHVREKTGFPSISATSVIERSLICLAREMGFDKPPPRR